MSKYHRKNINKTSKIENLKFNVLNYGSAHNKIKNKFNEFKKYHRISREKLGKKNLVNYVKKNF